MYGDGGYAARPAAHDGGQTSGASHARLQIRQIGVDICTGRRSWPPSRQGLVGSDNEQLRQGPRGGQGALRLEFRRRGRATG